MYIYERTRPDVRQSIRRRFDDKYLQEVSPVDDGGSKDSMGLLSGSESTDPLQQCMPSRSASCLL